MPIPRAPEIQSLPAEIRIAGEDLPDPFVDIASKARPHLIDLINLSRLVAVPGHSQAVGGVTRTVGGKGKAGGDGDEEDREGRTAMSRSWVVGEGAIGGASSGGGGST